MSKYGAMRGERIPQNLMNKYFDLIEDFLHNGGKNEQKILMEIEKIDASNDKAERKQKREQVYPKDLVEFMEKWPQYFTPGIDRVINEYMQGKM